MISLTNVLEWKQQHGEIYQVEINNQPDPFIFRAVGREEYKEIILLNLELGEFQEAICFTGIIYPHDYDFTQGVAGIADILSDAILDASGLHVGQSKELLTAYREEMYNYDYQVDCMIHEAFPEYTLEDIASWPLRKTLYYLSRAEWILQSLKGVVIQPIDETIKQDYQESQQMQQQQQPSPPPQPPKEEKQVQQKPVPEGGIQSEEELLAMLTGAGGKVAKPSTNMEESKPELNWFQHMDELKGDFD